MKRWFVAVVAAIAAALSPSVSAQWPLYPRPGFRKGLTAESRRVFAANGRRQAGFVRHLDETEETGPGAQPAGRPPLATFGNAGAGSKKGCHFSRGRRSFKRRAPRNTGPTTLMRCAFPKVRFNTTWIRNRERSFRRPDRFSSSTSPTTAFAQSTPTAGVSRLRGSRSRIGTVTPSDDGRATRWWSSRTTSTTMDGSIPGAARIPTRRG